MVDHFTAPSCCCCYRCPRTHTSPALPSDLYECHLRACACVCVSIKHFWTKFISFRLTVKVVHRPQINRQASHHWLHHCSKQISKRRYTSIYILCNMYSILYIVWPAERHEWTASESPIGSSDSNGGRSSQPIRKTCNGDYFCVLFIVVIDADDAHTHTRMHSRPSILS